MIRFLGLVASVLIATGATVQAQSDDPQGWQRFQEGGADVELRYPTHVFKIDPSKTSPAGHVFVTDDGAARLLIGALENVDGHTPASYQKFISEESYKGASFDYAPVGGSWACCLEHAKRRCFTRRSYSVVTDEP